MKLDFSKKFRVTLNKKEAKGVRKVYVDMLKLLKDPEHWTKGTEADSFWNEVTQEPETSYCLIGAVKEVDGPYELAARAFMLANPPAGWDFDVPRPDLDYDPEDAILDVSDDEIPAFNDDSSTTYKHVVAWLKSLIKKTDKIIAA